MFANKCKEPTFNSIKLTAALFILFTLLLVLTSCGGGGSGNVPALGGGLSEGEVKSLSFTKDNTAQINFSELSGSEEFSVLLFAANVNEGLFHIELQSLSDLPGSKLLQNPVNPPVEDANNGGTSDPTSRFHESLREAEAKLEGLEPFHPGDTSTGKFLSSATPSCADGQGKVIKVLNSLSSNTSYDTTCGIPVRTTSHAVYYVDQEIIGNIPSNTLDNVINGFENKIDLERSLLGRESDVDQDGLFSVYFTPAINRLGASGGGFITGFFFGGDLYPVSSMPSSNEGEIFFVSVPGNYGTPLSVDFWASNIAPTVLPHEYQHMISFNQHVLLKNGSAEEPWANEGLSHFMEDLQPSTVLSKVSVENPSRVGQYLSAPENSPFTAGTSIAQRGGAYLFFRYLFEQADQGRFPNASDGKELLKNLIQTDLKGTANIEEATGLTLKDLLLDFYATLQLSNTGITSNPRYNFSGICLTCSQDDNRGTVLHGVTSHSLPNIPGSGSVNSPGGLFFTVSGQTIEDAGQGLSFIAPPGMDPGGAIIRLK